MPLRLARGSSVETIVGLPAGVTARIATAAGWPPRKIVALPAPWIVHRFSAGASLGRGARRRGVRGGGGFPARRGARRRFAFLFKRRDRSLDARLDNAWIAAHHQDRIFGDAQRLRIGGLEVHDQRRPAGVGRRVDPRVDTACRHGGDSLVAAPVESGGEAAVHFRAGDDRRREGEHGDGEAQRIRVPLGHARRRRGDADRVDFALKPRPMGRPKGLRARIAVVIGEAVGKRGGGTVVHLRVAVEPGEHVARRGAAQSQERRESGSGGEREQNDPGDAKDAWRELPGARP